MVYIYPLLSASSKAVMCWFSLCLFQKFPIVDFNQRLISDFVCYLICHVSNKPDMVNGHIIVDCKDNVRFSLCWFYPITESKTLFFCILQELLSYILGCKIHIDSASIGR